MQRHVARFPGAGVGDEHIHPAEFFLGGGEQFFHVAFARQIRLDHERRRRRKFAGEFLGARPIAVGVQHQLGAFGGEGARDGGTNPAGGAGDEDDLAVQLGIHVCK